MRRLMVFVTSLLVIGFGIATPVSATVVTTTYLITTNLDIETPTCPSVDSCSLRGAIIQANTVTADNANVSIPAGDYVLTRGSIYVERSNNSTIMLQGAGDMTVIKQCGEATVACETGFDNENSFDVYTGWNANIVEFSDLRITGFSITDENGSGSYGGAAISASGSGGLLLNGVRLDHNQVHGFAGSAGATGGGAVRSTARMAVANSTMDNNTVTTLVEAPKGVNGGAAIYTSKSLQISDSSIVDNGSTIGASKGMAGGAIQIMGENLSILRSEISRNTLTVNMPAALNELSVIGNNGGAAIYQDGQDINIVDSTLDSNVFTLTTEAGLVTPSLSGANGGGAIYQYGNQTQIINSTVSNNVANMPSVEQADGSLLTRSGGGAIFENGNSAMYTNSTFVGNVLQPGDESESLSNPENGGGAIFFDGERSGININNSTIVGNAANTTQGGGIFIHDTSNGQTIAVFSNSIIGANTASATKNNCTIEHYPAEDPTEYRGIIASGGYNLSDDTSCGFESSGDLTNSNLGLNTLQDNGGFTKTMSLTSTSPARNAGNTSGCYAALGEKLYADQRGQARPQGGRCDIGAVEYVESVESASTCVTGSLGSVLFTPNSYKLSSRTKAQLREYAKVISSTSCKRVVLSGYTASTDKRSKSKAWRMALAKHRNTAVRNYLNSRLTKLGVAVTFTKHAYGSVRPVSSNQFESGRVLNRRVEITIKAS